MLSQHQLEVVMKSKRERIQGHSNPLKHLKFYEEHIKELIKTE